MNLEITLTPVEIEQLLISTLYCCSGCLNNNTDLSPASLKCESCDPSSFMIVEVSN